MAANVWNPGTGNITANAENGSLIQKFSAIAGQVLFTLTSFDYVVNTGSIRVYRNGLKLQQSDVEETSSTSFTLLGIVLAAGEIIECSAVLGSQDAVTAAALSAAASAADAAATLANSIKQTSPTGSALMPVGTTAQRDTVPIYGAERTNSDTNSKEWWNGTDWVPVGGVQLAGFRNVLLNGRLNINQRNATIAAAAIGAYGPDRWKKVDASNMTQIVEDGNYKYSSVYTLSGNGVTTQQITSPASGHWTIPSIPITATYVQLELGSIATPFDQRPIGLELTLCQRYFSTFYLSLDWTTNLYAGQYVTYSTPMRTAPTFAVIGSVSSLNVSEVTFNSIGGTNEGCDVYVTSTNTTTRCFYKARYSATAEL